MNALEPFDRRVPAWLLAGLVVAAVESSAHGSPYLALLTNAYAISGEEPRARILLGALTARSEKKKYVSPVDFDVVFTGLGDIDAAFAWLEKAFKERTMRILEVGSRCSIA